MTDERLEQILKQALAPEIAENDIKVQKKVRSGNMRKIVKRSIAAAACAALIVTVGTTVTKRNNVITNQNQAVEINNPFMITAYAAELEKGKIAPVIAGNKQSWALSGDEEKDTIHYEILTDFRCEGEGIDFITYRIENAAFNISEMADDSIISDAVEYTGELSSGGIGEIEDEAGNIISESRLLKEYTLQYDMQSNETTTIGICGEKMIPGSVATVWSDDPDNYETVAKIYDELLDGVEITCNVHFTDGSTASRIITVGGQVMTYAEAGMCAEGDTYDTGEDGQTKGAFFIYELKE